VKNAEVFNQGEVRWWWLPRVECVSCSHSVRISITMSFTLKQCLQCFETVDFVTVRTHSLWKCLIQLSLKTFWWPTTTCG